MEKVVSLCKRRGFVYPGSEIYGGLANTWDYGPYGSALKKNVKDVWWKYFVEDRDDMVGLDAAILMNPKTWVASGHVDSFSDPLVDCKKCKTRHRGDKLLEEKIGNAAAAAVKLEDVHVKLTEEKIPCPDCGAVDWTEAKTFNLMFKPQQGVIEGDQDDIYLRPETAQGIFVNFKNVLDTCRVKVPFGIGQIGKAFRNEITPGNFTFRTREFEMMEIEYFVHPNDKKELYEEWKDLSKNFYSNLLGIKDDNLRFREHEDEELSHYSSLTFDVEYRFPFGKTDEKETWGELQGLADRGDFDLTQHAKQRAVSEAISDLGRRVHAHLDGTNVSRLHGRDRNAGRNQYDARRPRRPAPSATRTSPHGWRATRRLRPPHLPGRHGCRLQRQPERTGRDAEVL